MAESSGNLIEITAPNRLQITKWKVRKGSKILQGALLGLYKVIDPGDPENTVKSKHEQEEKKEIKPTPSSSSVNNNNQQLQKLKSNHVGTVSEILVQEGQEISEGSVVLQIRGCSHPTVMKDMCADCGADLRTEMGVSGCRKENVSATVAMVHSIPELIVSEEQALELGRADETRLKKTRKLVLLVDLDQTLIHTTNDNIPPNLKGIHHFQLWQGPNLLWYHTRLRPHTQQFLENISKLYELHICTFGVRMYAHTIARFIDPAGKFFSHRILSRDECFNAMSKTANLKSLFPCGDSMVCIIDDREDVWNFSPNLIHVKPYRFFQGTADINAPTGFAKKENDAKPLTHNVRKIPCSLEKGSKDKNKSSKNLEKDKNVPDDESTLQKSDSKEEEKKVEVESVPKDKEKKVEVESVPKDDEKKVEVDAASKKEDSDAASKGQDVDTASKDEADDSVNPTLKIDAEDSTKEKKTEIVESIDVESKSDDEDSKDEEDSEGISEDSSMSGMSLCGNSSANATSNKDDSNADDNDDHDDNDNEEKMIEWEDDDDYLFYLEEILHRVHKAYFDISDQLNAEGKTLEIKLDLKTIIPYVKRKVLKGCNICFSGVIPLNTPIFKSRAYNVALSLGANVHDTFIPYSSNNKSNYTTHLIANKMGTSKVHAARRARKVHIVSLDWLWSCVERWDHVDESLFPLLKDKGPLDSDNGSRSSPDVSKELKSVSRKRKPGVEDEVFKLETKTRKAEESDSSGELSDDEVIEIEDKTSSKKKNVEPKKRQKRTGSHYNPLYSFSDEERANMDKELEELMDEDDSDSDEKEAQAQLRKQILRDRKCDTSSEDSLSGEFPHGWNEKQYSKRRSSKKKALIKRDESISEDSEASISEKYEKRIEVFAGHESDSTNDDSDGESIGSIDAEIAEAVEKEFLAR